MAPPRPPAPGSDPGLAHTLAATATHTADPTAEPGHAHDATRLAADDRTIAADDRTIAADDRTIAADDVVDPTPRLIAGAAVGRYVLQTRLGEGGMGVVWTAHDPELDRPVAIKLLTSSRSDSQARLLREAQAMAKLAHPNVVAVFDVGLHAGQVYVAMELVAGVTLRAWLDADPRRPWRSILDMFLQAGRGLAAAHAVGLVHRDFKPENALVGEDGRLRVLDFGLAALRDAPGLTAPHATLRPHEPGNLHTSSVSAALGVSMLASQLTQVGAVMGTLAYMSPEQHLGAPVDPRSDQFSFCVALYAALYGQRPFVGNTAAELALRVVEGDLRPPPRAARVPRRIARALTRGLQAEPARRHPSMPALLADLSREPWPRRHRWLLGGVAAALLGAGATALLQPAPARCEDPAAAWAPFWNDDARAGLRARHVASGQPFAAAAADGFIARVDAYLDEWSALRARACDEHHRGALADVHHARQRACLDRLLHRVGATIAVQRSADATAVTHAIAAAEALPPVSRCADAEALLAEVAPPDDPALAETIDRLAAAVVRADAESESGRYRRAREMLLAILDQPALARHPPTHALARFTLGEVLSGLGDFKLARTQYTEAHWVALAASADDTALLAAASLPYTLLEELGEREAGLQWLRTGEALLARNGRRGSDADLALLGARSGLAIADREYGRAVEYAREALDLAEARGGPDTLRTAHQLVALAQALRADGQLEASLAAYDRAHAIYSASVSPEHPWLARITNNRAITLELVDPPRALAEYARARDLLERSIGGDTVMLAAILSNLGELQVRAGDTATAELNVRRAVALYEASLGPVPRTAHALNALANLLIRTHQPRPARDVAMRSLEILTRTLGPESYEVTYPLHSLAVAERLLGDCVAATRHFRRTLAVSERHLGPDDPSNAHEWRGLGECALDEGRPREALAHFTRALELARAGGSSSTVLFARFHVAEARWALGERAAARAEAEAVHAALPAEGIRVEPHHRAELERWLATHPL